MLAALMMAAAVTGAPQPAPPIFVSGNYALTFRSPADTTICPLAPDWVGSDHGTVIFLTPPHACGGAGYPSSSRGFSPEAPRLEVYYQYWLDDPDTPPPPCRHVIGRVRFVRKLRPLCRIAQGGMLRISVSARYTADNPAWVEVAAVTTPLRLKTDLQALKALSASLRPCRASWSTSDGKSGTIGTGADCPADGKFF
jgi:hypothetical protein